MLSSALHIILAIFGLGFLVFIHEYGHYWVGRRVGMKVEIFSVGFGKPFYSWVNQEGVKWQLCWLLFGGYVKFAGMEKEGKDEPSSIKDGFFGSSPWKRIQVAFAGPFVNILFAFFIFSLVWYLGGREKSFAEYSSKIGWLDSRSELFKKGVHIGDEVKAYDGYKFRGFKDHLYASIVNDNSVSVDGYHVDYQNGNKSPFSYKVASYPHPEILEGDFSTIGILKPASFLIYDPPAGISLPKGSPMLNSGLEEKDRIAWADGEKIFSLQQLKSILNDKRSFLTIERKGNLLHLRIPKVKILEFRLEAGQKEELSDWQFASKSSHNLKEALFIPYDLAPNLLVNSPLNFIDKDSEQKAFFSDPAAEAGKRLEKGDKILAVDGKRVHSGEELFSALQTKQVHLIVQKNFSSKSEKTWKDVDKLFDEESTKKGLEEIVNSIGTDKLIQKAGEFSLLSAVEPKKRAHFPLAKEEASLIASEIAAKKLELEKIENPTKKKAALQLLEQYNEELLLGIPALFDLRVRYNPTPFETFANVFRETIRTFKALLLGYLNPKWISGPVGIVQAIQHGWSIGLKEALFWLAFISLNLAIVNLMPIPALDGGYIALAFIEIFTKKPLKHQTMEWLILPFVILLVSFAVFTVYNDVSRIISSFF